jgi:serine/threonine protein kinase/Tfp pilus assembly protein PilF
VRPAEIDGEDDLVPNSPAPDDACFGIYEIERRPDGSLYELGRGGMGVTYRAVDTSLQRKVALKIIKAGIARRSANARERFMREARMAAALRHENIATVYQFGIREDTGQYFYAMELIEGQTLEQRVGRAGPLSVRTTIDIAQQITAALAAAERHGLVHRDLKPANLMLVSPDDETVGVAGNDEKVVAKIIDFGLAKALHAPVDSRPLTRGGFVGTPEFASPEQFEHYPLDVRSDIYSLGATLWFALTGYTPFAGHKVEEIHRAQRSDVLPIEELKAARVPSRLRSLLESMLALDPASRPGTHELAARLQRCSPEAHHALRTGVALALTAIVILGVSLFFILLSLRTQNPVSNVGIAEKSLAVLPFENFSGDPQNAYFADGIQEEILTRLAKIADLKVISRTSTQQYQNKPRDLAEIAKQLGVANIVEGSVQRAAGQVRVNVHLINAQTDSHLWAENYDRKLTDIFGVESEIAKGIAETLQAKLSGREEQALAVKPTNNPEAYDAYLRGLAFEARNYSSSFRPDLVGKAGGFYERAVQLDPNFAVAWARLSRADAHRYFSSDLDITSAARRDAAKRALDNAQRLAPDSPETLLALGYYQYWVLRDYGSAGTTFERVSKMLPGSSEVPMALGRVSRREGHWDQSVAYFERALTFDPGNVELLTDAAETCVMHRQFPSALKLYDRVLDIMPNDPDVMATKARIYQAQGNLQEAAKFLSEINEQTPSENTFGTKTTQLQLERNYGDAIRLLQGRLAQFHYAADYDKATDQLSLAFMRRLAGDTAGAKVTAEQARNTLEQLNRDQSDNFGGKVITRSPRQAADLIVQLSQAYAAMGEKDSALELAERAIMVLSRVKDPVIEPGYEESLAQIQVMFGENSRAISTLTQLLQTTYARFPAPITPALLRLDPIWDPLRGDPAFQKLCEEKQD